MEVSTLFLMWMIKVKQKLWMISKQEYHHLCIEIYSCCFISFIPERCICNSKIDNVVHPLAWSSDMYESNILPSRRLKALCTYFNTYSSLIVFIYERWKKLLMVILVFMLQQITTTFHFNMFKINFGPVFIISFI